ncbi:MAG: DUF3488 and transglutaminase-like domain-containing protein [Campylobacterota bacterium]|nr:DUF3488 and transglutaminase-like domain-containing protein [Campylobacterota bacterium]
MRFYKNLVSTSITPSQQQLLDVALILSILPHLFIIKPVMILYLFVSLLFLIFAKEIKTKHLFLFGLLGGLALALSFYETFTFVGLKKLNIFVSLVISLLFVAVVLQRLSKQINFYLLFSPGLFLALSYFFYNTIMMLFYAITVLFVFLILLLWHRMQSSFMAAFKMAVTLFSFSIPTIVLLFLIFPRISFETKDFGFKGSETIRTGHDGFMHIGGDALLVPSKRVVMEVSFDKKLPPEDQLYFRGSTLYNDKTTHWAPLSSNRVYLNNSPLSDATSYQVTLYPHHKKWLYFLDYPLQSPKKADRDSDYIITSQKPVTEIMRYDAYSELKEKLHVNKITSLKKEISLKFDANRDDKLYTYMKDFNPKESLNELIKRFKALNLRYSLQPQGIDPKDPIDSFVFGNKQGYCVHFASTFATMARMAGIPSRIVTGFKANPSNSYENYLIVKEEDAHAWVEVYSEAVGWQRIETTQYALGTSMQESVQNTVQAEVKNPLFHRINLTYMYMRYSLQSWVLDYTRSKQIQLLHTLLEDVSALLKFIGVFLVLGLFAYLLRQLNHQKHNIHPALKLLLPLLKQLKKEGLIKEESESMEQFLKRSAETLNEDRLLHVSQLYLQARYGDKEKPLSALKALLRTMPSTYNRF